MKIATSITVWNDAVGTRVSITYSEIDPETGKIISDNNRIDRIITDSATKKKMTDVLDYAQEVVESL